jgi:hypothetical protein
LKALTLARLAGGRRHGAYTGLQPALEHRMSLRIAPRAHPVPGVFVALVLAAFVLPAGANGAGGRGIPEKANIETLEGGLQILRFERSIEPVRTIESVRIRNPWGDIRVRRAPINAVGLSFVVQRLAADGPLPDIDAGASGDRVDVRIGYPGDPKRVSRGGERPGRVDLVVFAPGSTTIDVETDDGELRVAHTAQPIRARSASGRILVSGASMLDVESDSGNVLGRQVGGVTGASRVRSGAGTVTVLISPTGDQRIRVRAGSGIFAGPGWSEADALGLTDGATRWERRYGKGRHRFEIESTRGQVLLMPFIAIDGSDVPDDADEPPAR